MHGPFFTKWQNVFEATTRHPLLKQARCSLGNDNLLVRRYVVAMRVRDESEVLRIPWVQPQILPRQINAAFVTNFNHQKEVYFRIGVSSIGPIRPMRHRQMWFAAALILLALGASGKAAPREEPRIVEKVAPLPVALDKDFEFRKTKLFLLSEKALTAGQGARRTTSTLGGKSTSPSQKTATLQDAPITFERQYRMFGAVTALDQRQRFGNYFDFFWRAKRPSDVTVRLEYRQEKLHEHVQAQEITYRNVHGTHKTEFKVIGDDYFDDGRVIAWRCLLIANGQIVSENRSYMWE
jgi:hypothetical protein